MCMVSVTLEYGRQTLTGKIEWPPVLIAQPSVLPISIPNVFKSIGDQQHISLEGYQAYSELLRKATEYDKIMNEPHCEDPNKMEFLKDLMERMDTLGEEFKRISMEIKALFDDKIV